MSVQNMRSKKAQSVALLDASIAMLMKGKKKGSPWWVKVSSFFLESLKLSHHSLLVNNWLEFFSSAADSWLSNIKQKIFNNNFHVIHENIKLALQTFWKNNISTQLDISKNKDTIKLFLTIFWKSIARNLSSNLPADVANFHL